MVNGKGRPSDFGQPFRYHVPSHRFMVFPPMPADFDTDLLTLFALMCAMLAVAVLFLVPTTIRAHDEGADDASDRAHHRELAEVLREQMTKLTEDRRAGVLTESEYAALREELERRALEEYEGRPSETAEAVEKVREKPAVKPLSVTPPVLTAGVTALLVGLSVGIYSLLGAPELMRLAEDQAVLEGTASAESIETYLKSNARDGRAWVLLARRRIEAGDFAGATEAYREGRAVQTEVRNDPEVMLEFGAALLTANDPATLPEAKAVLLEALEKDSENPKAVELVAIAAFRSGDWALAAEQVRTVLKFVPPDSAQYVRYEETLKYLEARVKATPEG